MNKTDKIYTDLLRDIQANGVVKKDRTGVGTISVFGRMLRFDLSEGFPLLTTKKIHMKSVIHELLWFLKGDTNIKYLNENGVTIWDEWADEDGNLGPIYGKQWVSWSAFNVCQIPKTPINQIEMMVDRLRTNPDCRRMIVSAWNVGDLDKMALTPCHYGFQLETHELTTKEMCELAGVDYEKAMEETYHGKNIDADLEIRTILSDPQGKNIPTRKLTLMWNQRSVDTFLGLPFNIASYAILLHMFAAQTNMVVGDLICSLGDTHIYLNHFDQVAEQLSRDSRPLPKLWLNPEVKNIFDYKYDDIKFEGYDPHPAIKAPIAI
jgi:thymidylate synthase